jgi:hypothetical protein
METRRTTNATLPAGLYWAQIGLYAWAIYAIGWTMGAAVSGIGSGNWVVLALFFGSARALAAYGVSNEGKWGYWMALIVCAISIVPTLNDLVHDLSLLLHPGFYPLLGLPVAIVFCLLEPSSRDYERTWFR